MGITNKEIIFLAFIIMNAIVLYFKYELFLAQAFLVLGFITVLNKERK